MKTVAVIACIGALMGSAQGATIYEIVRDSDDHTTLQAILDDANFADINSTVATGGITLFAPDNDAFSAFLGSSNPSPLGLDVNTNASYIADVKDILLYHVIPSATANAATLTNDVYTATALGTSLRVADGKVNDITITGADVDADNGLVHIIGNVLVPPPTLVDTVVAVPDLEQLEIAVTSPEQLDVLTTLSTVDPTSPVTVFAPNNAAFGAIEVPEDAAVLTQILQYHVVPQAIFNETLPEGTYTLGTLLEGKTISAVKAGGVITLNGDITVALADVNAKDGVAHVIDGVLIPPADEEEDEEAAASSVIPGFAASFVAACAYLMQ